MAPPLEQINYKEVTEIHRKEQRSPDLVEVRRDLYPAFRSFLEKLKRESEEEIRKDPYSFKGGSLANEVKKVSTKGQQIFFTRMRKIINMATRASSGAKIDLGRLTAEEREMYDQVLRSINDCRDLVMEGKIPEDRPIPTGCSVCDSLDRGQLMEALNLVNGKDASDIVEAPKPVERVLIRVLDDLPEIAGMDRPYRLSKDDVAYLPAPIGCALIKREKAQEITPFWRKAE
jgi:DNA replication initiation complex subunit (GINS family)